MLISAIVLDLMVLAALLVVKAQIDRLVIWAALLGLIMIFAGERYFIRVRGDAGR